MVEAEVVVVKLKVTLIMALAVACTKLKAAANVGMQQMCAMGNAHGKMENVPLQLLTVAITKLQAAANVGMLQSAVGYAPGNMENVDFTHTDTQVHFNPYSVFITFSSFVLCMSQQF